MRSRPSASRCRRREAWALLANVPAEFTTQLLQQALSPAALTTALLSAHMCIFWLAQDSNITPPVCITAFAAAAIADTPPMATGFTAWMIAKSLYIMPLLFAYTPFLAGDFWLSLWIFAFGTVGIYALTAAISGWMEAPLSWLERILLAATGTALLWPTGPIVNVPAFACSSSRCSPSTSGAAAGRPPQREGAATSR